MISYQPITFTYQQAHESSCLWCQCFLRFWHSQLKISPGDEVLTILRRKGWECVDMTRCEKCDVCDMNVKYGDLKKQGGLAAVFVNIHPLLLLQKHKMSNYINLIIAAKKPRNSKKLGAWGILKLVQVWQHLGLSFVKSRHALEWKVNGCTPTLISRAQPRKLTIQLIFRRVRPRQTSVSAKLPPFNGKNSRQRKVEIGRLRSISANLDLSLTKCSAAWGKTKPPVFLEFEAIMCLPYNSSSLMMKNKDFSKQRPPYLTFKAIISFWQLQNHKSYQNKDLTVSWD